MVRFHTIFNVDAKGLANALDMGCERKIRLGISLNYEKAGVATSWMGVL